MVLQWAISPIHVKFDKETFFLHCYFVLQEKCLVDILTFKPNGFVAGFCMGMWFAFLVLLIVCWWHFVFFFVRHLSLMPKRFLKSWKNMLKCQASSINKTSRRPFFLALDSFIGISFIVYDISWLSKPNSLSTMTSLTSASSLLGWAFLTT